MVVIQVQDENFDSISKEREKSSSRSKKDKRKGKSSVNSSSDDEELQKIEKCSRKKKWYSSDENSSFYTTESDSEQDKKKSRRRAKKKRGDGLSEVSGEMSKRGASLRSGKKEYISEERSASDGSDGFLDRKGKRQKPNKKNGVKKNIIKGEATNTGTSDKEITRKEMGLEWMLRSESKRPAVAETMDELPEEIPVEESIKVNSKELNPYLRDNGSSYPEDSDGAEVGANQLLSSSLVGDRGASWRLKALKHAQEQASGEGHNFQEVLKEWWSSLGDLTASVASLVAAPSRARLHAIESRKRGIIEENSDKHIRRDSRRDYLKGVFVQHHEMKVPKVQDSLSWGKRKSQHAAEGAGIISAAASSLNKFANDGSFMHEFVCKNSNNSDGSALVSVDLEKVSSEAYILGDSSAVVKAKMSANHLADKAMQLHLRGKHQEAEKLMQEAKAINTKQENRDNSIRLRTEGSSSRYATQKISLQQKKEEDDADMYLACKITQNKRFRVSTESDDEYDFEYFPSKNSRKKRRDSDHKIIQKKRHANRFLTQQECCLFCLENPNQPMHLVVSVANFTCGMLPQWQPVLPGLPIQHESATRTVDDNVWIEIRNFKKCLITMFAKQEKEISILRRNKGKGKEKIQDTLDERGRQYPGSLASLVWSSAGSSCTVAPAVFPQPHSSSPPIHMMPTSCYRLSLQASPAVPPDTLPIGALSQQQSDDFELIPPLQPHIDIPGSAYTDDGGNHTDDVDHTDDQDEETASRPIPDMQAEKKLIYPTADGSILPCKAVSDAVGEVLKKRYNHAWRSWRDVDEETKGFLFGEFGRYVRWDPQHTPMVLREFNYRMGKTMSNRLTKARKSRKRPSWIGQRVWENLVDYWKTDNFKSLSKQNKRNRASEKGGSLHKCGAVTKAQHLANLEKELGRQALPSEVFKKLHYWEDRDKWVEPRAQETMSKYESLEQASQSDTPLSDKARRELWMQAAGGNNKGRVYGMGRIDSLSTSGTSAHSKFTSALVDQLVTERTQQVREDLNGQMQQMKQQMQEQHDTRISQLQQQHDASITQLQQQIQQMMGIFSTFCPPLSNSSSQVPPIQPPVGSTLQRPMGIRPPTTLFPLGVPSFMCFQSFMGDQMPFNTAVMQDTSSSSSASRHTPDKSVHGILNNSRR